MKAENSASRGSIPLHAPFFNSYNPFCSFFFCVGRLAFCPKLEDTAMDLSFVRPDSKEAIAHYIEERKRELAKLGQFVSSSLECYRVRVRLARHA